MRRNSLLKILGMGSALALGLVFPSLVNAQEKPAAQVQADATTADQKALFESLEKMLNNVKLVGHFTVEGKPMKDLNEEVYEIKSIKKLPEDKMWLITARVKYSKFDVTLPMPLRIEWADKTPVITMDEVTLPGLGTFSARVLFHGKKYAGTWTHDSVGGHLFGVIEKMEAAPKP